MAVRTGNTVLARATHAFSPIVMRVVRRAAAMARIGFPQW